MIRETETVSYIGCYFSLTGEGDYTINTNQVRALFRRPTPPDNVEFTFRVDAIAQEPDESLTLELVPTVSTTVPSGSAVFFRNTIALTIVDSDSEFFGTVSQYHKLCLNIFTFSC